MKPERFLLGVMIGALTFTLGNSWGARNVDLEQICVDFGQGNLYSRMPGLPPPTEEYMRTTSFKQDVDLCIENIVLGRTLP